MGAAANSAVDPVDNASALPTGSTAHNSRHRRLLPHSFEARKPKSPHLARTRSRIVSETPTDSAEEAQFLTLVQGTTTLLEIIARGTPSQDEYGALIEGDVQACVA